MLVVALAVLELVCTGLDRRSGPQYGEKVVRCLKGPHPEKIAVFGSSRAVEHYVPSEFPLPCYNYGMAGSCLEETLFLLKQYLQSPGAEVVIVDLLPDGAAVGKKDAATSFAGDYRGVGDCEAVWRELPEGVFKWSDAIPGLRCFGTFKGVARRFMNYREISRNGLLKYDNGAVLFPRTREGINWQGLVEGLGNKNDNEFGFTLDDELKAKVEEIVGLCEGRRLCIVVSPAFRPMAERFVANGGYSKFLASISSEGVEVFDMINPEYNLERKMFYDLFHLNFSGALKFSRDLAARIFSADASSD